MFVVWWLSWKNRNYYGRPPSRSWYGVSPCGMDSTAASSAESPLPGRSFPAGAASMMPRPWQPSISGRPMAPCWSICSTGTPVCWGYPRFSWSCSACSRRAARIRKSLRRRGFPLHRAQSPLQAPGKGAAGPTLLALMELLRTSRISSPVDTGFCHPHPTASMVDARYAVTEEERQAILAACFDEAGLAPVACP